MVISLKKNHIEIDDSILGFGIQRRHEFFWDFNNANVRKSQYNKEHQGNSPGPIFQFKFKQAARSDIYNRSMYTIVDVLSKVGGLMRSV